ncbi:MAG: arylsulfatase [Cyclobacteriaceae bacterium]
MYLRIMGKLNLLFLLVIISGKSVAQSDVRHKSNKPNVIVILSDDQGWGDFSIQGNTNINTPNIDSLAKSGAQFENFYVSPVCSPTRAEILTGRYHPHSNVYSTSTGGERIDLDETIIAELFKSAGYKTGAYGKWHSGMQYPYHPNARGFDDFYGFCSGHWADYSSPMLEHNGKIVQGNGYITDDLTERAMQFIEKNRDDPFFLYVPYNVPHNPLVVPDYWWDKFDDRTLAMRHRDPNKEDLLYTKAVLAMCENMDWNVGRMLDKVNELGLKENTIVVYLCDNGPNTWRWNGGMKGRKGSLDEGGIRSPLFISWNEMIPSGTLVNKISGAIDLLPTLADLAGISYKTKNSLDGVSLEPLLFHQRNSQEEISALQGQTGLSKEELIYDNESDWKDRLLYTYWGGRASVRSQTHRLDNDGGLFDITKDRGQNNDISTKLPDMTRQLKDSLLIWKAEMSKEINKKSRPFPIGHPNFAYTQIPARDGVAHGNIVRSRRSPNDSFYTNWTEIDDKITWDVDVLSEGDYQVELYYTCSKKDLGSTIELSLGSSTIKAEITQAHDPPLHGKERVERREYYYKAFRPMNLGTIHLEEGEETLTLRAVNIPGDRVIDFRLLMFERIEK